MKTLTFFVIVFLIASCAFAQNNIEDYRKTYEGINEKGAHNLFLFYGYSQIEELGTDPMQWRSYGGGLGYLFAVTRNTNIGVYGEFGYSRTDELKSYGTTYYYSNSGFSILIKSQFFWLNYSRYIGFYSGLDAGISFVKPTTARVTSGNGIPHGYMGDSPGEQISGVLTVIGVKFRFGKNSHWYFYGEFALYPTYLGGLSYRF